MQLREYFIRLAGAVNSTTLACTMAINQPRPKYLNLFKIHLPVTGITSIAHRISGVILLLSTPYIIYLFALSVQDQQHFAEVTQILAEPWTRLWLLLMVWSFIHHFFAGIRFLLADLALGLDLRTARVTAWLVNLSGITVFLLLAIRILL